MTREDTMDPITFDPLGTISVSFDDETYTLTRPKMGQWRYFQRRLQTMSRETQDRLEELRKGIENAKTPKKTAEAEIALQEFASTPFYELTSEWVREVFKQLGDKELPADSDDWPAWLAADSTLPTQIISHWRMRPKASGEAPLS